MQKQPRSDLRRAKARLELVQKRQQSEIETLNNELCLKQQACYQRQRSKQTVETELKTLIGEIGEGGKNVHELEKKRKRLEAKVLEYEKIIKDEAAIRVELESSVLKINKAMEE